LGPHTQDPFWQVRPPEQALLQAPQWLLSHCRLRQPPAQQVFAQAGQTLPQLPQLELSYWRFLQEKPQQVLDPQRTSQPPQLLLSYQTLRQL
jgi:hypothetical protein